jgi:hypothetical protein
MDELEKTAETALALGNWGLYSELTKTLLPPGDYIARFKVDGDGSAGVYLVHKATQLEIGARGASVLGALCVASYHMKHDPLLQRKNDSG